MGETPLSDGWNVDTPKGTNMAKDTPEGHGRIEDIEEDLLNAQKAADEPTQAPQGHQPPDGPSDEKQIIREFLEALASSQYRVLDLGKIPVPGPDESQMLNDADLKHMKAAHALRNAQGAQAQLSNLVVSGRFGREDLVYKHLFDGWLALYDRLLAKESIESLDSWGSTPEHRAPKTMPEELYHDEETLIKVKSALHNLGFSVLTVNEAVNAMQDEGILFRERVQVNQEPTASERHDFDRPE